MLVTEILSLYCHQRCGNQILLSTGFTVEIEQEDLLICISHAACQKSQVLDKYQISDRYLQY